MPLDRCSHRNRVLLVVFLLAPAGGSAQPRPEPMFEPRTFTLGGAAGGAAYSAFLRVLLRVPLDGLAQDRVQDRRVSAETSVAFSGHVLYWADAAWGVRFHASYSPTRFAIVDQHRPNGVLLGDAPALAGLGVLLYDLDLVFRLPFTLGNVAAFGLVGAGRADYRPGVMLRIPEEARAAFQRGHRSEWAAVIGLGAVIPLAPSDLRLTFELTNHITPSPLGGRVDIEDAFAEEVTVVAAEAAATSNLRLNVGLGVPLTWRR